MTQLRGVARTISDAVEDAGAHGRPPVRVHPLARELLAQAGDGLGIFARLLADPTASDERERLRQALAAASETRRRAFRELPRAGADWHLYSSLFADLRRMLREIDPEHGPPFLGCLRPGDSSLSKSLGHSLILLALRSSVAATLWRARATPVIQTRRWSGT